MHTKLLRFTLLLILSIAIFIYFSSYDVVLYLALPIAVAISISCCYYLFQNLQNKKLKFIFSSIVIITTLLFLISELLLASLKNANNVIQTWKINQYEIQAIQRTFDGPEPKFYSLKKVYLLGCIYKEMDITFPENLSTNGTYCILEFRDVNLAFDLCQNKQEY